MNKILTKKLLAPEIYEFLLEAPLIAHKCQPGQFVMLRVDETSERIPLTIADFDRLAGTITLVIQAVGNTTKHICQDFDTAACFLDLVGPLGTPSQLQKFGTVVCVAGGVGVAPIYPIARAYKKLGNKIITIIGARSSDLIIWEDKMRALSDELYITTNDGSLGEKGFVTGPLNTLMAEQKALDYVLTIGPVIMMKNVAAATRAAQLPTVASLNSIMVDGTGMCGSCRVYVGQENKFACVDGPEFDAHLVDFDNLLQRQAMYKKQEAVEYSCGGHCRCLKE